MCFQTVKKCIFIHRSSMLLSTFKMFIVRQWQLLLNNHKFSTGIMEVYYKK